MKTDTRTVRIVKIDEDTPDALFCHYPGQTSRQPAYVELDLETGDLGAGYNGNPGPPYGMSESVYNRRTRSWEIPPLTAHYANRLLEELAPLAQRVLDGATIEWDGNNHVGYLNDDATDAAEEIGLKCDPSNFGSEVTVERIEASDWYASRSSAEVANSLGITADTTDAEIAALTRQEEEEARANQNNAGYLVPYRFDEYLAGVRNELRDEVEEELCHVASELDEVEKRYAKLVERRNLLARRVYAYGNTAEYVGNLAGLTKQRIGQIVPDRSVVRNVVRWVAAGQWVSGPTIDGQQHLVLTEDTIPEGVFLRVPAGGGEVVVFAAASLVGIGTGVVVHQPKVLPECTL